MGLDKIILVVEDNELVRNLLNDQLAALGYVQPEYKIVVAINGEEGYKLYQQHHPAIVLTDREMPNLDGYGLIKKIREESNDKDIPIIMISGMATEENRQQALTAGASEFLKKPYKLDELKALMDKYLLRE